MTEATKHKFEYANFLNEYAWFLMQEKEYDILAGVEKLIKELLDEVDKERWNY